MAIPMIDLTLDEEYDLLLTGNDLQYGESTAQHQTLLIVNNKGDYKQNPTIGVGAVKYLDDEHLHSISRAVCIEFSRDGMEVQNVELTKDGTIRSAAHYK